MIRLPSLLGSRSPERGASGGVAVHGQTAEKRTQQSAICDCGLRRSNLTRSSLRNSRGLRIVRRQRVRLRQSSWLSANKGQVIRHPTQE